MPRARAPAAHTLHTQLLHFLVVVLAVEDVPLLGAFEDRPLLAFDLQARRLINPRFLIEQIFENLAHFQPDGIAVFDEIHFIHRRERVGGNMRNFVYLVAAEPHSTALYLRTSSFFTLRNISW